MDKVINSINNTGNKLFRKTHRSKYSLNTSYQFTLAKNEDLDNAEENKLTREEKEWEKVFDGWETLKNNTIEVSFFVGEKIFIF